jgi:hypothetical protein
MTNFYEFKPHLNRCHILHFNDNKYRFQSRRDKHKFDQGSIFVYSPIARMIVSGRRDEQERENQQSTKIAVETRRTGKGVQGNNVLYDDGQPAADEYLGSKLPELDTGLNSHSDGVSEEPPVVYGNSAKAMYLRSTE